MRPRKDYNWLDDPKFWSRPYPPSTNDNPLYGELMSQDLLIGRLNLGNPPDRSPGPSKPSRLQGLSLPDLTTHGSVPSGSIYQMDPSAAKPVLLMKGFSIPMPTPTLSTFLQWLQANGINQQPTISTNNNPDWTPVPGIEPPKELYFSSGTQTKLGINLHLLEASLEQSLSNPQALDPYFYEISRYLFATNANISPTISWQQFTAPKPPPPSGADPRIGSLINSETVRIKAMIFPNLIDPSRPYYQWNASNESVPPTGSKLTNTITGEKYLVVTLPGLISITWLQGLG